MFLPLDDGRAVRGIAEADKYACTCDKGQSCACEDYTAPGKPRPDAADEECLSLTLEDTQELFS